MENKRRALGMGLEELFDIGDIKYGQLEEKIMESTNKDEITEIPLSELKANPYQPRKTFNEESLRELSESIKEFGVIQPIIVKPTIKGYEIIAGERRYRASVLAGKTTIPAIIKDFSDNEMMEIAILENLQREDLNAIEEATAYKSLIQNLGLTQDQVAKRLGKSRSHITNMLGLLSLPDETRNLIRENKITMGHARVLSKLEDTNQINELGEKIAKEGISVRDLENISHSNNLKRKNKQEKRIITNEYSGLQNDLSEFLGTKVKILPKKIEISFENSNDLNRILEMINYNNN